MSTETTTTTITVGTTAGQQSSTTSAHLPHLVQTFAGGDVQVPASKVVYISIGNNDDKLPQAMYAAFAASVQGLVRRAASTVHGEWASLPWSSYQNACWCVELTDYMAQRLKLQLAAIAAMHGHDSIAWAEAPTTEFIRPEVTA